MRKACDLKVGEKVIYRSGYAVRESVKVDKPIDDNERPLFLIGRVDLANGEYLTNGSIVYDSKEEAINDINDIINERLREIKDSMENLKLEEEMLKVIQKYLYI